MCWIEDNQIILFWQIHFSTLPSGLLPYNVKYTAIIFSLWLYTVGVAGHSETGVSKRHSFYNDVHSSLTSLVGSEDFIDTSGVSPYGYKIRKELLPSSSSFLSFLFVSAICGMQLQNSFSFWNSFLHCYYYYYYYYYCKLITHISPVESIKFNKHKD